MSEHVTTWLEAYHDGELPGRRLRQVEAHLAGCQTCRAELQKLRALTALLDESPTAEVLTPPDRFVAQVGLRLPRRPVQPTWKRALETGWRLIPVGLLGAWAFVQVVFVTASVVLYALQIGMASDVAAGLLPSLGESLFVQIARVSGTTLSDASRLVLRLLSVLAWSTGVQLIALIVIGLLYWSWLASWWARRQHKNGEAI
jgi:anti-sigma factor RsiW